MFIQVSEALPRTNGTCLMGRTVEYQPKNASSSYAKDGEEVNVPHPGTCFALDPPDVSVNRVVVAYLELCVRVLCPDLRKLHVDPVRGLPCTVSQMWFRARKIRETYIRVQSLHRAHLGIRL